MHKFKHAARSVAWYDTEDDEHTNYNPFKKIHKRNKIQSGVDEEEAARIPTNRSENRIGLSGEKDRQLENYEKYGLGPVKAQTMPIFDSSSHEKQQQNNIIGTVPSSTLSQSTPANASESYAHGNGEMDRSMNGGADLPTSGDSPESVGPRRRKGILQKLHIRQPEDGAHSIKKRNKSGLFSRDDQKFTLASQIRATILNSWINILLICVPIGIALNFTTVPRAAVFVVNFIAIIPLAAMLSFATEEIAIRVGETLGGLLNATFGNAVELIVSILALVKGEVDIVQQSLIGSMLSNLLLVMGMCFFFGGLNRVKQHFNMTVAQTASSLLALAVASLIIPAAFFSFADGTQQLREIRITELSRGTAILLLLVYGAYLIFQLKSHASMYNAPSAKVEKRRKKIGSGQANRGIADIGAGISATMGGSAVQTRLTQDPQTLRTGDGADGDNGDEVHEQPQLSKFVALLTLAVSTALVAVCAEFMVDSIDAITQGGAVSRTFVGLILLPIVGNAAEHATAVTVACKDKMDLAIGVAVGSSMQIALLIIPFTVVLGWILGNPDMNLAFDGFQIIVLFVSILLVNYLIQDGESHWLEGVLLQTLYLIIAIAAWFYPPDDPLTNNARR